jgi:hypothetical protein
MTTRNWICIAFIALLGILFLYLHNDWFGRAHIQIYHRSRPARVLLRGRPNDSAVDPIVFGFDHRVRLKALKITPLDELRTNKYAPAIWDLVSDSNSAPIEAFDYGASIRGMRPRVKGLEPEPLQPGVAYRLHVELGREVADHDFTTEPRTE